MEREGREDGAGEADEGDVRVVRASARGVTVNCEDADGVWGCGGGDSGEVARVASDVTASLFVALGRAVRVDVVDALEVDGVGEEALRGVTVLSDMGDDGLVDEADEADEEGRGGGGVRG